MSSFRLDFDFYLRVRKHCSSCEDVTGPECYEIIGGGNNCGGFEYDGESYETIPREMVKEAVREAVGIEEKNTFSCSAKRLRLAVGRLKNVVEAVIVSLKYSP